MQGNISEFMQQDVRKKRMTKCLCETNVAGLFLACCPHVTVMFCGLCQKKCLKESEVWRKVISNKIIVTLVIQGLLSSFHSCPVA